MRRSVLKKGLLLAIGILLIFCGTVSAFSDLPEQDEDREKIMNLQEMGIINGINGAFQGDKELTYAEGIQMIVKGMDLSLAAHTFIKAPETTDYFDQVPQDAWYADSFIIAAVHGLELSRDVHPNAVMTKEAYAHHLMTALFATGNYPFTKMLFPITDEDEFTPAYTTYTQLLLNGRIATLDEEGKFYPQQTMTRKDAALLLYEAIEFKNRYHDPVEEDEIDIELPVTELPEPGHTRDDVTFYVTPVSEEVNKVTVSWGEQPHPGYGISIAGITFDHESQTAIVQYQLSYPLPDRMYPQVIVYPEAHTYVSAEYEVKIVEKDPPAQKP